MSSKQTPFGDESWRIRDIQFDDPEVRIGLAAPIDIGRARLRIRGPVGSYCFPYIAAGRGEPPFEERARGAAVTALDENHSGPVIARRKHGGEAPGRVGST